MGRLVARTPRERSDRPLPGFKLAHPMLSADGTAAAFSGVTLGSAHVYRAVDDAICVHGSRHACPSRWCDCGFYCFHTVSAARDLACEQEYAGAVLLEVAVSGRYRRYEKGLRYARQRVRTLHVGSCGCGHPAQVLVHSGNGSVGWRRLAPVCRTCAGSRPVLAPAEFGRLAGGVPVLVDGAPAGPLAPLAPVEGPGGFTVLMAEVALLQARLDDVQSRLDALVRGDGG